MKSIRITKQSGSRNDVEQSQHKTETQLPRENWLGRRGFLQALAAGAGSMLMAGCGGGSSSSPANTAAVQNRARKPKSSATPAATPAASNGSMTWGVNGHWSEGGSYNTALSTQVATLKDLGFTHYRQGIFELAHAQTIANNIPNMSGIAVLPTIVGNSPLQYADETAAYNDNFTLGAGVAKLLAGKVPYYELGGEFDALCNVTYDGSTIDQYDQTAFILCRGALRGLIDGIKTVDAKTPIMCAATAGWLHTAFSIALWFGQQPDGTSGHPTVRWDVTMYHWYSDMGDITNANGTTNVLATLRDTFGKPIWITEFGSRPDTEANVQAFITNDTVGMPMFSKNLAEYNIIGVSWFELYDSPSDPGYGLLSNPSSAKPRYNTMKTYIASQNA
ncbi:glycosyl hydrolase [Paraburkholderia bryophila]|uniref:glycosyl hydrolase n=1 Tax=Burkholderiaceae TaxID=119060 RepID=UPI0009DE2419|nr:glycosyl hydrolase [Burkholderia sp. 9120]